MADLKKDDKTLWGTALKNLYLSRIANNANKNDGHNLAYCFTKVYTAKLKANLGGRSHYSNYPNAGIATGGLLNHVHAKRVFTRGSLKGKSGALITMQHKPIFRKRGFYIGISDNAEASKSRSTKQLKNLVAWIKAKKAQGGNFKTPERRKGFQPKRIAYAIMNKWYDGAGSTNRKVLPKWYDLFKDGDEALLREILKERNCISSKLTKMMSHGK